MLHVELVALAMSLPYGLWGMSQSTFAWPALGALALLGVLGTGFAFVLFALLNKRTGAVRSMIPTYFTPIVGTVLGKVFNNEPIMLLSIIGMMIVIVGAWLTSLPERQTVQR
jgi:drug/metabolite transporter (DMT)-like permease